MNTFEEKIKQIKDAKEIIDNFQERLWRIIYDVYSECIEWIIEVEFKGDEIYVQYSEYASHERWIENTYIPVRWLEDGFDYRADHERMVKEEKEKKKREKEEEEKHKSELKKKKEAKKLEKERAEYERLKAKFENKEFKVTN